MDRRWLASAVHFLDCHRDNPRQRRRPTQLFPPLPAVSHDLCATMSLAQMTLTACILGLAFGQIIIGPLSDAWGRRWPLLLGIALYVLTPLLCLVAPTITLLAVLRFVQGFAGAAAIVIALAIALFGLAALITFLVPCRTPQIR